MNTNLHLLRFYYCVSMENSVVFPHSMRKNNHYIIRLRHNRTLCCLNIVLLWIAMVISIPAADIDAALETSPTQRILSVNPVPLASPRIHSKSAPEVSETLIILLHETVFEKHVRIFTVLEHSSLAKARILTYLLLYTQTTSSYL
jgi:hypothetical protein